MHNQRSIYTACLSITTIIVYAGLLICGIRNHFWEVGIAPENRNRRGRNFTRIRQLRWHAITLQIFGALDLLNGHKMAAKTLKQRVVSPTSQRPIFFQFEHKTWNGIVMNSFGIELRTFFPIRDYLPTETSILGCLPTDFRCTARIPAFAFRYLERIWALHFIG